VTVARGGWWHVVAQSVGGAGGGEHVCWCFDPRRPRTTVSPATLPPVGADHAADPLAVKVIFERLRLLLTATLLGRSLAVERPDDGPPLAVAPDAARAQAGPRTSAEMLTEIIASVGIEGAEAQRIYQSVNSIIGGMNGSGRPPDAASLLAITLHRFSYHAGGWPLMTLASRWERSLSVMSHPDFRRYLAMRAGEIMARQEKW
jgi:hypothetical protein